MNYFSCDKAALALMIMYVYHNNYNNYFGYMYQLFQENRSILLEQAVGHNLPTSCQG